MCRPTDNEALPSTELMTPAPSEAMKALFGMIADLHLGVDRSWFDAALDPLNAASNLRKDLYYILVISGW